MPNTAHSYNKYCEGFSKSYQNKVASKFKQNPFFLVESFLNLQQIKGYQNDSLSQNTLIIASFDINKLYRSNRNNFKSKVISKIFFDWVRTQYFNNLKKNFSSKSNYLLKKNSDLLTKKERIQMSSNISVAKGIKQQKCTQQEASLLGCKNVYIITAQTAPSISCKDSSLEKAFESKFYLTFSKKYGFKIIDISIVGKRIVLDSIKHMLSLKNKGFNKNAIASHISMLATDPNTFKFPKRQTHTKKFLADLKRNNQNRLPSSL